MKAKRFVSAILCMVIVMGMLPITAKAQEPKAPGKHTYYIYDGTGSDGNALLIPKGEVSVKKTFVLQDNRQVLLVGVQPVDYTLDMYNTPSFYSAKDHEGKDAIGYGLHWSLRKDNLSFSSGESIEEVKKAVSATDTDIERESAAYIADVLAAAYNTLGDSIPDKCDIIVDLMSSWWFVLGDREGEHIKTTAYSVGVHGSDFTTYDGANPFTVPVVDETVRLKALSLLFDNVEVPDNSLTGAERYAGVVRAIDNEKFIRFLGALGYFGDYTGDQLLTAAESQQEAEAKALQQMLDSISKESIASYDYMGKIRYLALAMNDPKRNGTATKKEDDVLVEEELKQKVFGDSNILDGYGTMDGCIWSIYKTMRDEPDTPWSTILGSIREGGNRDTVLILAWYCYVYYSGAKAYADTYVRENQLFFDDPNINPKLNEKVMTNMSVLAAAYDYLKGNVGEDIIYTDVSGVQAALTWGVRMKAAIGLANGLFEDDNKVMSVVDLLGLGSYTKQAPIARTPTTWIAQPESHVVLSVSGIDDWYYATSPGITATALMSAELGQISYYMTNVFAIFVKDKSKNFAGRSREIEALRQLYEDMMFFDDPAFWELWNMTAFDTSTDKEDEKLSLNDVYEYLRANNAFNILNSSEVEEGKPFAYFFDNETLSNYMVTGIKESASFIPMRTNVYDPYTWKGNVDTEWLVNFYAKFGYMRKVLYIDTNQDAASNFVNTGGRGNLEVATLSDLLQDKDIVLYLGDNLYNVDDIADMVGKAWDRLGNSDDTNQNSLGAFKTFTKAITGLWEVSMEEIAKSGSNVTYSSRVPDYQVGNNGKATSKKWRDKYENFFLPMEEEESVETEVVGDDETVYQNVDSIRKYLYIDDLLAEDGEGLKADASQVTYSPMLGFAVLSGIYRDPGTKKDVNQALSTNTPVFISSNTSPYLSESRSREIYNYLLCRNLEAVMPVDYSVSLDMTSPLYMDIFGNILTESGTVVIPAAANATLWAQGRWHAYNAAFLYTYGKGYTLDYTENDQSKSVNAQLEILLAKPEGKAGKWALASLKTVDGTIDMSRLSIADNDSLDAIVNTFAYELTNNLEGFVASPKMWKMLITEVLRGAPIEDIDKQFEDIQTNTTYTRQGLIVADKLESLVSAISPAGQNASIAIPNPAYIEGIEVIVFFIYKLLILAVLIVWMVNIYLDATGGGIGLRTGGKCIGVVVLVIAMIVGVPKTFELTYYESNKRLLQEETEYLLMLNLEKQANGEEIGVSRVDVPKSNTKLYLRLADVEIPWWNLLSSITVSAGYNSLDSMYREYENRHPLAYTEQAVTKNGGIYIDTDTLFESAKITFSPYMQVMYVTGADDTPASYYTPYYYFLDTIVDEISRWSKTQNFIAYTTKIQRGGELKTMGYATAFFESEDFIAEGADLFGLYRLYNQTAPTVYPYLPSVSDGDLDLLRESQWCNMNLGQAGVHSRIQKLNLYAQEWIANNRGMLGRVSDETFLKCFALSCAMEHNRLFNTQRADYLEIQELSNEDLLRLSIAPHNEVMANSAMSYARFVYTTGGTMAVYVAAVLEIVNFISSWVKPACTLSVFLIACASIFILKLIMRRGNNSLYGYIITIALMCSVNVLGALFTKLSMYIPNLGFTPTVCMLIQILVQIGYIYLQLKIVSVALKDWRNSGYQQYESTYNRMRIFNGGRRNISRDLATKREPSGWNYYDNLTATLPKRRLRM